MILFWFGFFAGSTAIVLMLIAGIAFKKNNNAISEQHLEIVKAQLLVFNERMVEERRLACALETLVEHVTSTNSIKAAIALIRELSSEYSDSSGDHETLNCLLDVIEQHAAV